MHTDGVVAGNAAFNLTRIVVNQASTAARACSTSVVIPDEVRLAECGLPNSGEPARLTTTSELSRKVAPPSSTFGSSEKIWYPPESVSTTAAPSLRESISL